jgi:two-component system, cell cycle response regulator
LDTADVPNVDMPSKRSRAPRKIAFGLIAALAALLVAYAVVVLGALGSPGLQDFFGRWVYDAVVLGAAAVVLARAALVRDERGAWLALGTALLLWALGQTYYSTVLYYAEPAPFPSPSDAAFLAFYPASYVGLVLLLRARVAQLEPLAWVDGLIGALAVAGVAAALIFPPVLDALGGSALGVAVNLAYPCFDLVLLGLLFGGLGAARWRGEGVWVLIAGALLTFAAADVVYLSAGGQSTEALNLATVGWPLAFLMLAAASWLPAHPRAAAPGRTQRRRIVAPILLATVGIGLLVVAGFQPIGIPAIALAAACLFAVLARLAITFELNARILERTRDDAFTDALTGLHNRRRLVSDLEKALAARPAEDQVLALYDLDGFKAYNDSFGHPAGDDLLSRLGGQLAAAMAPFGRGYRLGGDEFCVLGSTRTAGSEEICRIAEDALTDRGRGFSVTASWGMVRIPAEAATPTEALRIADRRMYARKGRRADSARSQTRGVLLRVLHEREPELERHLDGVARLAAAVGRQMNLDAEELDVLVRAAELHDIGKVAIPDEVLHKPGPLTDAEWALMRKHTEIGERVLAAAPALGPVAKVVRSTHERWDGKGYPDGLAGREIPLGSRIIFVCDAFNAITEGRPYKRPLSREQAIEALREGAGTQFDPDIVRVFAETDIEKNSFESYLSKGEAADDQADRPESTAGGGAPDPAGADRTAAAGGPADGDPGG